MKRIHLISYAVFMLVISACAQANTVVMNNAITEEEIVTAQKAWCAGLLEISNTNQTKGQAAAKEVAKQIINQAYDYALGIVLFKPTLTVYPQIFRETSAGALAYFVGGDANFPNDTGFALQSWKGCRIENAAILLSGPIATTMGRAFFTKADGSVTTVDKTLGYRKDDQGNLRIMVHHSSLELRHASNEEVQGLSATKK